MTTTPRELINMMTGAGDMRRPMQIELAINVGEDGERVETVAVSVDGMREALSRGRYVDVLSLRLLDELPHNATRGEP